MVDGMLLYIISINSGMNILDYIPLLFVGLRFSFMLVYTNQIYICTIRFTGKIHVVGILFVETLEFKHHFQHTCNTTLKSSLMRQPTYMYECITTRIRVILHTKPSSNVSALNNCTHESIIQISVHTSASTNTFKFVKLFN